MACEIDTDWDWEAELWKQTRYQKVEAKVPEVKTVQHDSLYQSFSTDTVTEAPRHDTHQIQEQLRTWLGPAITNEVIVNMITRRGNNESDGSGSELVQPEQPTEKPEPLALASTNNVGRGNSNSNSIPQQKCIPRGRFHSRGKRKTRRRFNINDNMEFPSLQ